MRRYVAVILLIGLFAASGLPADELSDNQRIKELAIRLNANDESPDYQALADLARAAGDAELSETTRDLARKAIDAFRHRAEPRSVASAPTPEPAKKEEGKFACSVMPQVRGLREPECQPVPIPGRGDTRKACEANARAACLLFCGKCGCRCGGVTFESAGK